MVFSSLPPYLDPSNWQQQPPDHPTTGITTTANAQLLSPPPPPPPQAHGGGSSSTSSIRPGSMAERARLANIPMPEAPLKCPRCESANTKFCYFNNYSLSQPRHFCKTCRRYWTRGGALRNVPVGGGCRRNNSKRSKVGSSKSSSTSSDRKVSSIGATCVVTSNGGESSSGGAEMLGLGTQLHPLRFMAPSLYLPDNLSSAELGLNYNTGPPLPLGGMADFSIPAANTLSSSSGGGALERWRLTAQAQQFSSSLGRLDPNPIMYPFEGGFESFRSNLSHQVRPNAPTSSAGLISQLTSVKMEENNRELNSSSRFLGMTNTGNDHQLWGSGGAWTDLSGFSSSSTSNPL